VCIATSTGSGAPDASEAIDAPEIDAPQPNDTGRADAGTGASWERPLRLCAGSAHACAIHDDGVYCWGANHSSQLGDSPTSTRRDHEGVCGPWECNDHPQYPVLVAAGAGTMPLTSVTAIACGTDTSCALRSDGSVWCWGADTSGSGVLGHSGTGSHADVAITSGATSIEVGRFHACARVDGELVCWGQNDRSGEEDGRLGSAGPSTSAPRRADRFADAWELALGGQFTCGVGSEGVRCVGRNEGDVTGLGRDGPNPIGSIVPGLPPALDDLSAGAVFACAIAGDTAHCWGAQTRLVLADTDVPMCFAGSPFYACRSSAEAVDRGFDVRGERLVRLSRGPAETMCAITDAGRVLCWGWNAWGQAGLVAPDEIGSLTSFVRTLGDVPLEGVDEVACGAAFCCARTTTDAVHCWGENDFGQLGNGTTDSLDPIVDGGVPDGGTATVALPHPRADEVDFTQIAP
jgi:alpha-tubulin suppressor-like RCC1 family protein